MATLVDDIETANSVVLERITVDQYHEMMRQGILREGAPVELIDGLLVRKDRRDSGGSIMTVGPGHATMVKVVVRVLNRLVAELNCHVQTQQPIAADDANEPEPDVAVVIGNEEDYSDRHPQPGQIALLVEVADSSLAYDRGRKLETYASNGIAVYWIVNLQQSIVEVYRTPESLERRYRSTKSFHVGDEIPFDVDAQSLTVRVSELF